MVTWDEKLDERGVKLTVAQAMVGEPCFRLVEGKYLGEWGGRHSIFVEVLNEMGNRMVGQPVRLWWNGGSDRKLTEAKPLDEWALDFPMYEPGHSYGIAVDGRSDSVFGMGLGTIAAPSHKLHVSYRFVFQRMAAEPLQPVDKSKLILQMMDRLQRAQELTGRAIEETSAALALLSQVRRGG